MKEGEDFAYHRTILTANNPRVAAPSAAAVTMQQTALWIPFYKVEYSLQPLLSVPKMAWQTGKVKFCFCSVPWHRFLTPVNYSMYAPRFSSLLT